MKNLQRPSPEIERRLTKLEKGEIAGGNARVDSEGDAAASGEYEKDQLYLAYASNITNVSVAGLITNQSDATDFQFEPFAADGSLMTWRGADFSKSYYQSGDATDYTWVDITSEAAGFTFERYTTTSPRLLVDLGDPDNPGSGVTWDLIADTSLPIADTVFWVAERYTIDGVTSAWAIYPANTKETGFGLISYTITGRNKPVLGDTQWNTDVLVAVSSFTGLTYSSITEIGYGTAVGITYDNGTLYGLLKKVSGTPVWVTPTEFIDGALLVDTTIIEAKIADNAVTVNKILNDAINSDKIADNAVLTAALAANAITETKIADNAITTGKIVANAITAAEIAAGTITATEIQANAIGANEIAANSITAGEIAANAITTSEIAAGAVTAVEITAGTITTNLIASNAITTDLILADNVTADKMASNSITSGSLVITGPNKIDSSTIGAVTTFSQTTAPTAVGTGDLWTDTDDGNRVYRWSGVAWVDQRDTTIATAQADASTAITNAATAQGTADGKVTTFYVATAPTAEGVGDLWSDTDDGNTLYRWSGTAWVNVQDSDMATAISNAATAQSTADGKIVSFYQTTAPTAEGVGDLWTNTDDGNQLYRWNGTSWVTVRDTTIATAQATADSKVLAADVAAAVNNNATTINGAKITTGTVQAAQVNLAPGDVGAGSSATTGSRMNITSTSIKIYDSSGTLRVTLGDLT